MELNNGKTKGEVVASLITAVDEYANSDDPLAKEAHDQFKNRVEVSDYCAENQVEFTDFETFKGFINGVTADPNSVEEAHSRINEHLHSRTNVDDNSSDGNELVDELSELNGDNPDNHNSDGNEPVDELSELNGDNPDNHNSDGNEPVDELSELNGDNPDNHNSDGNEPADELSELNDDNPDNHNSDGNEPADELSELNGG